jgi:hypothetical protein
VAFRDERLTAANERVKFLRQWANLEEDPEFNQMVAELQARP